MKKGIVAYIGFLLAMSYASLYLLTAKFTATPAFEFFAKVLVDNWVNIIALGFMVLVMFFASYRLYNR